MCTRVAIATVDDAYSVTSTAVLFSHWWDVSSSDQSLAWCAPDGSGWPLQASLRGSESNAAPPWQLQPARIQADIP